MASHKRWISSDFWQDSWTDSLTCEEKLVYIYLLTNESCTIAGVFRILPKRIASDTGILLNKVNAILAKLMEEGKILVYQDYIAILNFPKHQVSDSSPKTRKGIETVLRGLPVEMLAELYRVGYGYSIDNILMEYGYSIDTLSVQVEVNKDIEVDIDKKKKNKKEKRPSFEEPSADEVKEYCINMGFKHVDAEGFVNFYASKGWMVGKNKMVDWHKAVAGWNSRGIQNSPSPIASNDAIRSNADSSMFLNADRDEVVL